LADESLEGDIGRDRSRFLSPFDCQLGCLRRSRHKGNEGASRRIGSKKATNKGAAGPEPEPAGCLDELGVAGKRFNLPFSGLLPLFARAAPANHQGMFKIVVALILFAHGIGHIMGPLKVFNLATINPQWQGDSWLLGGLGVGLTNVIGVGLWLSALVGFSALAAVVMGWLPGEWWAPLAVFSSLASLAGVLLFPVAFPTFSTIGAVVVDAVVLASVVWFHWTPAELAA